MATAHIIATPEEKQDEHCGREFDRLTVLEYVGRGKSKNRIYRVRCVCGTVKDVFWSSLAGGLTRSCGCLHREVMKKHGHCPKGKEPPIYRAWVSMKQRCYDPNCHGYENYGGRGIAVCERWRESFEAFLADVGPRPSPAHSLDRYPDKNGDYEPGNVRWATDGEQSRNRRNNVVIVASGQARCVAEWAPLVGRSHSAVLKWVEKGTLPEQFAKRGLTFERVIRGG